MKKKLIYTLLPALFAAFTTIGFTSCGGDDEEFAAYHIGGIPYVSTLAQSYFVIDGANYIDGVIPGNTVDKSLTTVYPSNISSEAGKTATIEVASDLELDKFYIGVNDISTQESYGYYEVAAVKKSTAAGLNFYDIAIKFPLTAKSEFFISLCGMKSSESGKLVTNISKVFVYLSSTTAESPIIGTWGNKTLITEDGEVPVSDIYYEYSSNGEGMVYHSEGQTPFEYNYEPTTGDLRITTAKEHIVCSVIFSRDKKTMNVTEESRTFFESATVDETIVKYSLTKVVK